MALRLLYLMMIRVFGCATAGPRLGVQGCGDYDAPS
jgi:hypothetical protein